MPRQGAEEVRVAPETINRREFVGRSAALAAGLTAAVGLLEQAAAQGNAPPAKNLKVGWSTIYLTPSWMKETSNEIQAEIDRLKKRGVVGDYKVFDANGDSATQIAQIQSMIDQKYDIVLLIAGSATALNPVVEKATAAGLVVVNWDSLVTTDKLTAKVFEDQVEWGRKTATWLVNKLDGKGKILTMNGPAGIAVSEARWSGAKEVFDKTPGIKIEGTANVEYNEAPALVKWTSLLAAHPDINGIWCQAGAHAAAAMKALQQRGMKLVPMTGENFNAFLKMWCQAKSQGFSAYATAEVNYMAVISLDLAVMAKSGQKTPKQVVVPLPEITNENVCDWASNKFPDDWYVIPHIPTTAEIDKLIADSLAAEESGKTATPAS